MAAIVCTSRKRSIFEDLPTTFLPASKKLCYKPYSRPPPPPKAALLAKLKEDFPDMEQELLEKVLDECGHNIDSVINKLHDLNLQQQQQQQPSEENLDHKQGVPREWVDIVIGEMMSATSADDAQACAFRVLQHVCRSIGDNAGAEAARVYQNESRVLKEQIEVLVRDNSTLKSLAVKLYERQNNYENNKRELEQLKQLVSQGQERVRRLEVDNYALTTHLQQALQSSCVDVGRFNPHVF